MRIQEDIIVPAQDQQYQNFIVRYNQNLHGDFDYESDDTFQIVNDLFGILYVPGPGAGCSGIGIQQLFLFFYSQMLHLYGSWSVERIWRAQASRPSISQIKRSRNTGGGH